MPLKRQKFFIKGNFQIKFIILFVGVLVLEIGVAALNIYQQLYEILEQASFSAHLSLASSRELFWKTLLEANLMTAGISMLLGAILLLMMHVLLESFFRKLTAGLDRLAQGDYSCRLNVQPRRFWSQLAADFDSVSGELSRHSDTALQLLEKCLTAVESGDSGFPEELEAAHRELRQLNI